MNSIYRIVENLCIIITMNPISHKIFKLLPALLGPILITSAYSQERPNIVLIVADDLGYGDIRALNNNARTQTPALDQLVSSGITFSEAHSSASVCTPSRYGILTGRYAFRSERAKTGITGFEPTVIEEQRPTIASLLQAGGYATAAIGKWHLGVDWVTRDSQPAQLDRESGYSNVDYRKAVGRGPNHYGFDYSFIHPASLDIPPYLFLRNHLAVDPDMVLTTTIYDRRLPNTVFSWDKKHSDDLAVYWEKGVWWREGEMSESFRVEECQQEIIREGVGYIESMANSSSPFFLYLPLTSPHTPWLPDHRFKGNSGAGVYGDFVRDMDEAVNLIVAALKENGLYDNTLLIFTSDNGAYWPDEEIELFAHDSNAGRKGQKGDVWDGGHRVPLIMVWPTAIKESKSYPHLFSLTDLFATLSEIAGQTVDYKWAEDSYSFAKVLTDGLLAPIRHSMVHHTASGKYALRLNNWKLIDGLGSGGFTHPTSLTPGERGPAGQLYDLDNDPGERLNLYQDHPDRVAAMDKMLRLLKFKGHRLITE